MKKEMKWFGHFLDLVRDYEAQYEYFSSYWALMRVYGPMKPINIVYGPLGLMKLFMAHHGPLEIRWIILGPLDPKYLSFMDVGPIRAQLGFLGPK